MSLDITNHFLVSLAYKTAVIQAMLGEGNFFAERLHLSEPLPIVVQHIKANVNPPLRGGLGSFETDRYFYSFPGNATRISATNLDGSLLSFPERGKLAYVEKRKPFIKYGASYEQAQGELATLPSLIDTNSAYILATQWLAAISVDVRSLETKHQPLSAQQYCYSPPLSTEEAIRMVEDKSPPSANHKKISLPIFDVTWGGTADQNPPVWVQILGTTKQLVRLRMEDTTFLKRSPLLITNALELNSRQDPQKKHLTPKSKATNQPRENGP